MTLTMVLLVWRGGMVIRRLRISPRVTASRCSQTASMCHPRTKGVGSTIGHAASMNVRRLRRDRSARKRRNGASPLKDALHCFELCVCEPGEIDFVLSTADLQFQFVRFRGDASQQHLHGPGFLRPRALPQQTCGFLWTALAHQRGVEGFLEFLASMPDARRIARYARREAVRMARLQLRLDRKSVV